MKIKAIIIDDEPLAREGLKNYIKQVETLELAGSFSNPLQAMKKIDAEKIDLMFLDIQMPKLSGIDFLKTLTAPPVVIITTAYPGYALQGFELDVMDYLVKPVSFEKFLKAVNKAREYIELKRKAGEGKNENGEYFFIKSSSKYEKINYDDIIFIEALQNYVVLNTAKKKHIAYMTLKNIYSNLPKDKFIKTHKSFIINKSKIDSIEGSNINAGEHIIPISRDSKESVLKQITSNKILKR